MSIIKIKTPAPENKEIQINVDDTTTLKSIIERLKQNKLISSVLPYRMVTSNNEELDSQLRLLEINEREFLLTTQMPKHPASSCQLGVFLLDGSRSMLQGKTANGQLAVDAVSNALNGAIQSAKKSGKSNSFIFSVVVFGDTAVEVVTPTAVGLLDDSISIRSTKYFKNDEGSDSTNIASGLEKAITIAEGFLKDSSIKLPKSVVFVLLSDGMCHNAEETKFLAQSLKSEGSQIRLCSCHLKTDISQPAATVLLQEISTKYEFVYDEATVRDFFIASSQVFPRG